MKEKITALLKAKFTGVRIDGLNQLARTIALQAATDEEAKTFVEKLTKEQVDNFVKEYRADVDKEVSDGNKTFESNLKKKYDLVEKKDGKETTEQAEQADTGDIATLIKNAVAEAVKPFQTELTGLKQSEIAKTRLQSLSDKLKDCKDETFKAKALKDFARMSFETDDAFNEYLTETETDIQVANQNVTNSKLGSFNRPWMANDVSDNKEASKTEIDAVFERLPI